MTATEVDIGRGEVVEAFVVTPQVVVIDELGQALFELARQVVVAIQNSVSRVDVGAFPFVALA